MALGFKKVIPKLIPFHIKAGIFGLDIYRVNLKVYNFQKEEQDFRTNKIPECLGIAVAMLYACGLIIFYGVCSINNFKHFQLILKSNLIFVGFNTFLGYVDDIIGKVRF